VVVAAPGWLTIRVELMSGAGQRLDPPPGRDFLVSSDDSLFEVSVAIDTYFARWDRGHLHLFRLPTGAEYVLGGKEEGDEATDTMAVTIGDLRLSAGTRFEYVFDLGDEWVHRCEVLAVDVDPEAEFGDLPPAPVPLFGWGSIPDQYGRTTPD
jgi:hypothetical protein